MLYLCVWEVWWMVLLCVILLVLFVPKEDTKNFYNICSVFCKCRGNDRLVNWLFDEVLYPLPDGQYLIIVFTLRNLSDWPWPTSCYSHQSEFYHGLVWLQSLVAQSGSDPKCNSRPITDGPCSVSGTCVKLWPNSSSFNCHGAFIRTAFMTLFPFENCLHS